MDKKYEGKQIEEVKTKNKTSDDPQPLQPNTKYRIKLTKTGILRYFSHLDWQNTFFKALARSGLNVAFSQGFNPSMKVSLGVALPLFVESICELVDIELTDDIKIEELHQKLEKVMPQGSEIIKIEKLSKEAKAIDITVQWALYEINLFDTPLHKWEDLRYNMDKVLSSDEILLTKKNKKGFLKTTNIKPSIKSYDFQDESLFIVLKTGQGGDTPALRADDLMKIVAPDILFDIKRTKFFDENVKEI
jgi:radical SAM-linked protein